MIWCAVKKWEYTAGQFWISDVLEEPAELPAGFEWMTDAAIVEFRDANMAAFNTWRATQIVNYNLKIFRYVKDSAENDVVVPPFDLDFITGLSVKLHRKQIMVKGEVQIEEYYQSYNGVTYSDLIVKEQHAFTRNVLGFAMYRTTTITWYNESGLPSPETKVWTKFYDPLQTIEEGITRRGNIVKYLQPAILSFLQVLLPPAEQPNILILGRDFLNDYKIDLDNFVDHSDKTILTTLADSSVATAHPWTQYFIPSTSTKIITYIIAELTL